VRLVTWVFAGGVAIALMATVTARRSRSRTTTVFMQGASYLFIGVALFGLVGSERDVFAWVIRAMGSVTALLGAQYVLVACVARARGEDPL